MLVLIVLVLTALVLTVLILIALVGIALVLSCSPASRSSGIALAASLAVAASRGVEREGKGRW